MKYDYLCDNCGYEEEKQHSWQDAPLFICPSCGEQMRKAIKSAPSTQFKGAGWDRPEHTRFDTLNNKKRPKSSYKDKFKEKNS